MANFYKFPKLAGIAAILVTTFVAVPNSQAATISLNFEDIDNGSSSTNINNFYNGGTSSIGTSGVDYGVTFSSNALALSLNTLGNIVSNTSRGGQGDVSSRNGALFFLSGTQTFINYATGFDTGFSFFYSTPFSPQTVNVYDDLNGAGNVLATLNLPATNNGITGTVCTGYSANYCPFVPFGVSFAGTAKSIGFGGTNQAVYDDVTFGSVIPGDSGGGTAVPEPFTIVGTLIGAGTAFRMRKRLKATNKL
jgi:hypothetical protein